MFIINNNINNDNNDNKNNFQNVYYLKNDKHFTLIMLILKGEKKIFYACMILIKIYQIFVSITEE